MRPTSTPTRTIGFLGATGVGVGAIVGGGILVLAGVAFAETGPSAIVAFAVNGLIALVTALAFAEISTSFPQSGGTYAFAIRFLGVRPAFAVGWVLWFAYIVAGLLYALGFAAFTSLALGDLWSLAIGPPPEWIAGRGFSVALAVGAVAAYVLSLVRSAAGGGQVATVGKVVLFVILIAAGLVAVLRQPVETTTSALSPFFSGGASGLVAAMGFTFIALQGFDLIPAIAGEIKEPRRTIPRAMLASLAIALVIYIPLLFTVASAGAPDSSIARLAAEQPETVMALAIRNYFGVVGYWMVIVAAIFSTLSALRANLLAASRVAQAMASDRTLPKVVGRLHPERATPLMAIYATGLTLVAILFMLPDVAAAGAAASLIFLIAFTLTHIMTYLARTRGGVTAESYRTPWFPLIPVVGGLSCASMVLFQIVVVPEASKVALLWLGLGVILYVALFKSGAEIADATFEALDPDLARLRGKSPLVLLPVANPAHAPAMVAIANALAPPSAGRVLLLSIVRKKSGEAAPLDRLDDAQRVVREALSLSYSLGSAPEALITTAEEPWTEIRRVANEHHCESLLLGLGKLSPGTEKLEADLEALMNDLDCNVAVLRADASWRLAAATRVLVPVGGRGDHELRARMLGAIAGAGARTFTFLSVLGEGASDRDLAERRDEIATLADLRIPGEIEVEVSRAKDPPAAIIGRAANSDLVVLGLKEVGWGRRVFGDVALRIASESPCAAIMLSYRRSRAYSELYRPLREAIPLGRPRGRRDRS
jgi:amino acid transporter